MICSIVSHASDLSNNPHFPLKVVVLILVSLALFFVPASAPQLVSLMLWYVLSLAANQKE